MKSQPTPRLTGPNRVTPALSTVTPQPAAPDKEEIVSHDYSKTSEALSRLNDQQYRVTQKDGTEPAFRNEYWDNHEDGLYAVSYTHLRAHET